MSEKLMDLYSIAQQYFENSASDMESHASEADDGEEELTVAEAKEQVLADLEEKQRELQEFIEEVRKKSLTKLRREYL